MMGALLGLGGTWFLLNYKWVAREVRLFVNTEPGQEEKDEEDEE